MSANTHTAVARRFVPTVLPWLVGIGGLILYLATLNRWVSLLNLGTVARVSKWDWYPELGQPLLFILLYPFGWLPESAIPLALNVFTAMCAALVLVLLARSIALLPHDVIHDDLLRKDQPISVLSTRWAWMPPVVTAALCGLQLSFWEHATSASGAMLDLLVFAYVVRCLFEYRIDRNPSWLYRSLCVYGAGMANNWALVGILPLFLGAIVRTTGIEPFLDRRFRLRLAVWGGVGFSLFLLLPLIQITFGRGNIGFWKACELDGVGQGAAALALLRTPGFVPLACIGLVLLFVLSIRWKSHTVQVGDDSPLGVFMNKTTGHVVHGLLVLLPLWISLDPVFSPRHLVRHAPMLIYYYISALVFGYCAGYFLVLKRGGANPWQTKAVSVAAAVLFLTVPAALVRRNLGQIQMTNGPALEQFARWLYADLPSGRSVVLSEDTSRLLLLRAELDRQPVGKEPLLVDTLSMRWAQYQCWMAARFSSRWPVDLPTNRFSVVRPARQVRVITAFAAKEPVVYLHPSSGLFVEPFIDQPNGCVHYLLASSGFDTDQPALSSAVLATNDELWRKRWTQGLSVLAGQTREAPRRVAGWTGWWLSRLRLEPEENLTGTFLGTAYSKSLDYWGVMVQRSGRWKDAADWFQKAIELNPRNVAARINSLYNDHWQHGDKAPLDADTVTDQFRRLFAGYANWAEVISANGPVDEPAFLFKTASMMLLAGYEHQGARGFKRCSELAPDWTAPDLWLARSYLRLRDFAKVLEVTDRIEVSSKPLPGPGLAELLLCRARAMQGLGETNEEAALIRSYVSRHGEHVEVLSSAADLYESNGRFAEELSVMDRLLAGDPNNAEWLTRKGYIQFRMALYRDSADTLTRVLSAVPSNGKARLLRAVAYVGAGQLDAAREDYLELLKASDNSRSALLGLGGIAWREHYTNAAIEFYRRYLSNAVPDSPRYDFASNRLQHLERIAGTNAP
jgi:Tetratricopeptide repeat